VSKQVNGRRPKAPSPSWTRRRSSTSPTRTAVDNGKAADTVVYRLPSGRQPRRYAGRGEQAEGPGRTAIDKAMKEYAEPGESGPIRMTVGGQGAVDLKQTRELLCMNW